MVERAQDQVMSAGVEVMAVGDGEAADAVGSRRRKKVQTELRGEHAASKELGGARRAVKNKKKGTCAGTVSTAEEAAGKLGGAGRAATKKMPAAKPDARTEFLGVRRRASGKYTARISDWKVKSVVSLGSFGTAEEAARAYDAAAVELRGTSAVTNFEASGELCAQAAGSVKMKVTQSLTTKPKSHSQTGFRGVYRLPCGRYRARIGKGKSEVSLGRFGTAEEAARAYEAAAVELHGVSAVTDFKAESSGQAAGSIKIKVKPAAARPDARTEFRGVYRVPSGKYRAQVWDSKAKSSVPLGSFGTAEEAARAYDAAAVKLYGAAARTNFEQQPTAAATNFEQMPRAAAADGGEVLSMDILDDYPELPALDFSESLIPGPQMEDLRTDLPPAEWQLVHEFLKDFDQAVA